jgi:hypothetical protein
MVSPEFGGGVPGIRREFGEFGVGDPAVPLDLANPKALLNNQANRFALELWIVLSLCFHEHISKSR